MDIATRKLTAAPRPGKDILERGGRLWRLVAFEHHPGRTFACISGGREATPLATSAVVNVELCAAI